jgi:3-hydroxyacyl-CoA dehydrogenase
VWRGGPMFYADTVGLGEVVSAINRYNQLPNGEPWVPAPLLARLAAAGESFSSFDSSNSGSAS